MCDHYRHIYHNRAATYDSLVAREDRLGNLFQALNDIRPLDGLQVLEFGAGTGRLTRLLAAQARHVHALDIEMSMLNVAGDNLHKSGMTNWSLAIGDNRRMPVASKRADLVIEGWSFAHAVEWHGPRWRNSIDAMLSEMERIARPDGSVILIETMGTGGRRPRAPSPELASLYNYWQSAHGFNYRWIRTDYQFASMQEADELLREFFGDALADQTLACGDVIVPECTGIWWKTNG